LSAYDSFFEEDTTSLEGEAGENINVP
jgi:hypothetical protein